MEEKIKQEMPFDPKKVIEAVEEIAAQGPGSIARITENEVEPFIKDIETLAGSMANLYQEHAAHFIALGVKVNIVVEVMGTPAFKSQIGASVFDDHGPNIVKKGGEDAATPVQ